MTRHSWMLRGRVTDENGTPWDEFVSLNGALLKRVSADCRRGEHPMRCYALLHGPAGWYPRIKDLIEQNPAAFVKEV